MSVFEAEDFDHHETVAFFDHKASGLRAIIALHSTALGPACGGTRVYPYSTTMPPLTDVLRPVARHELQERDRRSAPWRREGRVHRRSCDRQNRSPAARLCRCRQHAGRPLHHGHGCRHDPARHADHCAAARNMSLVTTSRESRRRFGTDDGAGRVPWAQDRGKAPAGRRDHERPHRRDSGTRQGGHEACPPAA